MRLCRWSWKIPTISYTIRISADPVRYWPWNSSETRSWKYCRQNGAILLSGAILQDSWDFWAGRESWSKMMRHGNHGGSALPPGISMDKFMRPRTWARGWSDGAYRAAHPAVCFLGCISESCKKLQIVLCKRLSKRMKMGRFDLLEIRKQ